MKNISIFFNRQHYNLWFLEIRNYFPRLQNTNHYIYIHTYIYIIFKIFYLFIFRERGRAGEREGEKHQCVVAFCMPQLGTWPTTQACALTGNRTGDPLVRRLAQSTEPHQQGLATTFKLRYVGTLIL